MKPGECGRKHCEHDKDAHHEGKWSCSVFRCDCRGFVDPSKPATATENPEEGFCDCTHMLVDHSAAGCHWCSCRWSRR